MNIQLIRMMSNEMVVVDVIEENDDNLIVKEPVGLVPTKEGSLSFVPWSPLTEPDTYVKVYKRNIVYSTQPNEEVIKNYKETLEDRPPGLWSGDMAKQSSFPLQIPKAHSYQTDWPGSTLRHMWTRIVAPAGTVNGVSMGR